RLELAGVQVGKRLWNAEQHQLHPSGEKVRQALAAAAIGNFSQLELTELLQQLGCKLVRAARAGRAVVDLSRIPLGQRDEALHVIGLERRVCGENQIDVGAEAYRRKILDLERQVGIEVRTDGELNVGSHQQRVAARGGLGDEVGADIAAPAGL